MIVLNRPHRLYRTIPSHWLGVVAGVLAVSGWAAGLAYARLGITQSLEPVDLAAVRFIPAGIILSWWLLRQSKGGPGSGQEPGLGGVSWSRGIVLAVLSGPLFMILSSSGYQYTPLSHGALIQPTVVALGAMAGAALFLREELRWPKLLGASVIIVGLATFASNGSTMNDGFDDPLTGDALFVLAALLWATFTILMKKWQVSGLQAIAVTGFLSLFIMVPTSVFLGSWERLASLSMADLLQHLVIQGGFAGIISIIAFGKAVHVLGASKAALFPAIMPVATLVIGIPLTGELPLPLEWVGSAIAIAGLIIAVALRPAPNTKPRFDASSSRLDFCADTGR